MQTLSGPEKSNEPEGPELSGKREKNAAKSSPISNPARCQHEGRNGDADRVADGADELSLAARDALVGHDAEATRLKEVFFQNGRGMGELFEGVFDAIEPAA